LIRNKSSDGSSCVVSFECTTTGFKDINILENQLVIHIKIENSMTRFIPLNFAKVHSDSVSSWYCQRYAIVNVDTRTKILVDRLRDITNISNGVSGRIKYGIL